MQLAGAGVIERDQQVEGLLPGRGSGCGVSESVVGVAEVLQDLGLQVAATGSAVESEGSPVAVDRALVVAEVVVGVAEGVPCSGFVDRYLCSARWVMACSP
ncbi:hypothetical protein GCM10020220_103890 [Nonomuraea rubra]